ncbi:hypothetical protein DBR17_01035 [Sphingomonas sp. HMWF008]|nr:hypothetical protein DBR17_01035 [Sphingomonas sp. HMWF008]
MRLILTILLFAIAQPVCAQALADNPDMTRIFTDDQKVRESNFKGLDIAAVLKADAERREATRALLDSGKLTTGTDFWEAAFIFQHGDKPADYLLAHSLAIAATAKGRADAAWISAATLDRYLDAIKQPQVYGTQFRWKDGGPVTQEPYDRTVVSDRLRAIMGVPPLAEQEKRRQALEKERGK